MLLTCRCQSSAIGARAPMVKIIYKPFLPDDPIFSRPFVVSRPIFSRELTKSTGALQSAMAGPSPAETSKRSSRPEKKKRARTSG
jgi:hypothetical protein